MTARAESEPQAGSSAVPRRRVVLLAAFGLFGLVLGARFAAKEPSDGLTFLFVVPVILIAVEFGVRAGVAAGIAALGLFALWVWIDAPELDSIAYLSRGLAFVAVGALVGRMANRLRAAAEATAAGARFFSLSRDLLATANLDGYLVELNGAWEATLGWSPEELKARPFVEFVHPDDRERTEREAATLGQDGVTTASFTNRYRTKAGGWRWIEWSSSLDAEHGLIYAAARDVSDRRAAERGMREAEERFRRSIEDSGVGKALVGVRGEEANPVDRGQRGARPPGVHTGSKLKMRVREVGVEPRPRVYAGPAGQAPAGGAA